MPTSREASPRIPSNILGCGYTPWYEARTVGLVGLRYGRYIKVEVSASGREFGDKGVIMGIRGYPGFTSGGLPFTDMRPTEQTELAIISAQLCYRASYAPESFIITDATIISVSLANVVVLVIASASHRQCKRSH